MGRRYNGWYEGTLVVGGLKLSDIITYDFTIPMNISAVETRTRIS